MTELIKQALFQVIGDVTGFTVADLFAGSGQIGIEALSRGASFAAFVESNRANAETIRATLRNLAAAPDTARVLPMEALVYLKKTRSSFDLIFADPPYEHGQAEPVLRAVADSLSLLARGGLFILRHTKHESVDPVAAGSLEPVFSRCYGDAVLLIYRRPQEVEDGRSVSR